MLQKIAEQTATQGYLAGYKHKKDRPPFVEPYMASTYANPAIPLPKKVRNSDLQYMKDLLSDPKFDRFHKDKQVWKNTFLNMIKRFRTK